MMNFWRQLMGQQGFSLVQGMVLAGVLAGTSLVATRLVQDQKLSQKAAESKDQLNELHKAIFATLQSNENCQRTITDSPGLVAAIQGTAASSTLQALNNFTAIRNSSGTIVYQGGVAYANGGVEIKNFTLAYHIPGEPGRGEIRVNYQRLNQLAATRTKEGMGAKDITKPIKIRVVRNTTSGAFESCYAVSADADDSNAGLNEQMCDDMEIFRWVEESSKCELRQDLQCNAAQGLVFTGINSTGEALCRPLKDWINYGQIFESSSNPCPATYTVRLQVDSVNKKVRVVCTPP